MKLRTIGKYELLEELGRGGFAVVYKARDTTLDRIVALKVLRQQWADDPQFVTRFRQEAHAAANLRHPNIVTIHDTGEADGYLYNAMAYLPGRTLHDLLEEQGELSLEAALPILEQMANALDYAHAQGVVHRDIKPANVMVEKTASGPHVTLMDFGLVKAMEGSSALTSQGALLGSPEYMAPEQADLDRKHEIGPATDRYALGVVAYRMLVGHVPFPGNTPATLHAHLYTPPPDPQLSVIGLPPEVTGVLLTMLAKAPADRFPTATAFVAQLREMHSPQQQKQSRESQLAGLYQKFQAAVQQEAWEDVIQIGLRIRRTAPYYADVVRLLSLAQKKCQETEVMRTATQARQLQEARLTPLYAQSYAAASWLDYLDFELEIDTGTGREYPVRVINSPAGQARETMHFPFGELELENNLLRLRSALLASGGGRRIALSRDQQAVQNFGRALFDALLTGEVRGRYDISLRDANLQGRGLRLKLRINTPEMAMLPWEFLYDPRSTEYVCLSHDTPIVRYLELPRPIQPLTVTPPLRILGMVASPSDLGSLNVAIETQRVENALRDLQVKGLVELTWLEGQTWRALQQAMRRGEWHIFHFIGHGGFDAAMDEGLVMLCDDDGRVQRIYATELGRLLANHRALRLVLLNACESATGSTRDLFSSTASILVRRGIPAVLAMQYPITDRAAVEFSHTFYESLVDGLPVDAAVVESRVAISLAIHNTVEWGTPVLFMRSSDGVLFRVQRTNNEKVAMSIADVSETVTEEGPRTATQYEAVRLGERAAYQWAAQGQPLRQAEALQRFARTLADEEAQVALWEQAAALYVKHDQPALAEQCRLEIARCRRQPDIALDIEHAGLVLNQWTRVQFSVHNAGFGPARQLIIHTDRERFEGQAMATQRIGTLAAGAREARTLDIKPLESGDSVPLRITVEFTDHAGQPLQCAQTIHLPVVREPAARAAPIRTQVLRAAARFVDLAIRIFRSNNEGHYPVEIVLANQQHFTGAITADLHTWTASGNVVQDGRALLTILTADPELANAWARCRGQAEQRRVRLWLDAAAPELHVLPWELLCEDDLPLAASAATPFSRYLPTTEAWGNAVVTRPLRMLAAISNPTNLAEYDLVSPDVGQEQKLLARALGGVDDVQVDFLPAPVTLARLEERLRTGYHLLHLVGHGVHNTRKQEMALCLQDSEGQMRLVDDAAFGAMLARQGVRPRLVVLATCHGATRSTVDAWRGMAPALVRAGVPAVVAMQGAVALSTAQAFTTAFYRALAEHGTVDLALNQARGLLISQGGSDVTLPVLIMRLQDGQPFL